MKALRRQVRDGEMIFIGGTFYADPNELRALVAEGLAVRAVNSTAAPRKYQRRDLQPQQ